MDRWVGGKASGEAIGVKPKVSPGMKPEGEASREAFAYSGSAAQHKCSLWLFFRKQKEK